MITPPENSQEFKGDEIGELKGLTVRDSFLGIFIAIVAVITLFGGRGEEIWTVNHVPGPAFLPDAIACGLLVTAVWIGVRNRADAKVSWIELTHAASYFGLLVASAFVFTFLGALVTVGLYVALELRLLHSRSMLSAAAYGLATAVGVWLVFVVALGVRLPLGILTGLME